MLVAPILSFLYFSKIFMVETYASLIGIGAVLMQEGHPISYFSNKIIKRRKKASTYAHELYAITQVVDSKLKRCQEIIDLMKINVKAA